MASTRQITQETFEEAVQENMELFEMSRIDATLEALTQFRAQGAQLDSILLPEECQSIAPAAEVPHIPDSRDGLFLQSDAEIISNKERLSRVNYDKGDAVKLPGKVLGLKVLGDHAFVGEACSTARRIHLGSGSGSGAVVYKGHAGPVACVEAASGRLYTGSWDKTVKVWDVQTTDLLMTLHGHGDFVKSVRVIGQYVYTGCHDKNLRQWDLATGTLIRTYAGHRRGIEDICGDPRDNDVIFTASSDGTIGVWDMKAGKQTTTLNGHDTSVYCIRMHEGCLYSASADNTARQWDVAAGKPRRVYQHPDWVRALEVRDTYLFTGGRDGYIRVWDVEDESKCMQEYDGHFDQIEGVGLLDDGSRVVSAGLDGTLRSWCLASL